MTKTFDCASDILHVLQTANARHEAIGDSVIVYPQYRTIWQTVSKA